jgi:hypothetical protein
MHQMSISTNQVSLVVLRPQKLEIRKKKIKKGKRAKKAKSLAMKLNQIGRRIELCMREMIVSFT